MYLSGTWDDLEQYMAEQTAKKFPAAKPSQPAPVQTLAPAPTIDAQTIFESMNIGLTAEAIKAQKTQKPVEVKFAGTVLKITPTPVAPKIKAVNAPPVFQLLYTSVTTDVFQSNIFTTLKKATQPDIDAYAQKLLPDQRFLLKVPIGKPSGTRVVKSGDAQLKKQILALVKHGLKLGNKARGDIEQANKAATLLAQYGVQDLRDIVAYNLPGRDPDTFEMDGQAMPSKLAGKRYDIFYNRRTNELIPQRYAFSSRGDGRTAFYLAQKDGNVFPVTAWFDTSQKETILGVLSILAIAASFLAGPEIAALMATPEEASVPVVAAVTTDAPVALPAASVADAFAAAPGIPGLQFGLPTFAEAVTVPEAGAALINYTAPLTASQIATFANSTANFATLAKSLPSPPSNMFNNATAGVSPVAGSASAVAVPAATDPLFAAASKIATGVVGAVATTAATGAVSNALHPTVKPSPAQTTIPAPSVLPGYGVDYGQGYGYGDGGGAGGVATPSPLSDIINPTTLKWGLIGLTLFGAAAIFKGRK